MESLLILTFGPVQSFLAQARKTQDLYAGSFLLSYLCRVAITKAKNDYRAEIIFPNPANPSLPNRFVALLPEAEKEKLQEIGVSLERCIKEEFLRIGQEVLRKTGLKDANPVSSQLVKAYEEQLQSLLKVYWVAGEAQGEPYAKRYEEVERYLEAVKRTCCFDYYSEQGRKCALTGEQNALFYRKNPERKRKAYLCPEAKPVPEWLPLKYLQEGECLGGIAFVKRCAEKFFQSTEYKERFSLASNQKYEKYEAEFPSTAEIALMETLSCLSPQKIADYKNIFGSDFNDHFFYQENLDEKVFEREGIPLKKLAPAREKLAELEKEAEKQAVRFARYYVVLYMDGDNMGKWVTGKFLEDEDLEKLQGFQKELTQKLGEYASGVAKVIFPPKGCRVYCGGDDILALLNLNHLVPVLEELQEKFPSFKKIAATRENRDSSVSAGICIAHYKEPLAEVLNWARRAEEKAKEKEKDSFALTVLKHSGEIHQAVFRWRYENLRPLILLQQMVKELLKEDFSDTFIRNLAQEFRPLIPIRGQKNKREEPEKILWRENFFASEEEMIKAEISRLLERACKIPKEKRSVQFKKVLENLKEELGELYIHTSLENFLSFLEIAAFLTREVNKNVYQD